MFFQEMPDRHKGSGTMLGQRVSAMPAGSIATGGSTRQMEAREVL